MFRLRVVSFVALALFWFVGDAVAQDSGRPWRLTYNDPTEARNPVATYWETREQAEGWKDFVNINPLKLTNFRIEKVAPTEWESQFVDDVKDAKDAVDKAREIQKKGLAALV